MWSTPKSQGYSAVCGFTTTPLLRWPPIIPSPRAQRKKQPIQERLFPAGWWQKAKIGQLSPSTWNHLPLCWKELILHNTEKLLVVVLQFPHSLKNGWLIRYLPDLVWVWVAQISWTYLLGYKGHHLSFSFSLTEIWILDYLHPIQEKGKLQ